MVDYNASRKGACNVDHCLSTQAMPSEAIGEEEEAGR